MRLGFAFLVVMCPLYGQVCPPARILPADRIEGSLDDSSCRLSDGTAYASYRLDLATRGRIQIDLASESGLGLILRNGSGAKLDSGSAIQRPVEAGSYAVVVNGRTPDQAGGYSVKTAFAPESGMLCSAFASIGFQQTVAGTLGASGCLAPDGTPYEAYTLNTFGAGTLNVSVTADFTPTVILRDDGGRALASSDTQISLPVDAASQYQVVVMTADRTGSYQVTTGFAPDASETCREKKTLSDSGSDSDAGSITAGSCSTTATGSGELVYFNYYSFNVTNAGLVDLTASSRDFAPTLYLLDNGGNVLAADSGGGGELAQSELRLGLRAGSYILQVASSLPSGGAYTLTYRFDAAQLPPCAAAAANPGGMLAGTLSSSSCRNDRGPADIYTVRLPASGTLTVALNSTSFSGVVAIRDSKDNLLVRSEDAPGLGASQVTADLPAGDYTIAAAASFGSGDYQLSTGFTAHEIAPCSYAQPLDLNGGYIQKLRPASCRDTDGQPMDLYEFTLPSDGVALAVLTSSEIDGFLRLADTGGNVLRSDDNSYSRNDPMIVEFLPAGTYRLVARAASSTGGGYYEIDLRTALGRRPPFCAARGSLSPGTTISASLGFTACQYTDATFADLYQIALPDSATIDLHLDSNDFDAYLVLLDAKGNVVDEDDDEGGGSNARINRSLPAGTYYVVAKPRSDYYHLGAYTLSLGQLQ